jgi:hypothetical protein
MSEDAFARHRNLLFTVACEVLGSAVRPAGCIYAEWPLWRMDSTTSADLR